MDENIKNSINMRTSFFEEYYIVPQEVKPEVDAFIDEINLLGETSSDAMDFESRFAATGLSEQFNVLLTKCTPKAYKMSKEEKQVVKETKKEMFDGKEFAKHIAKETLDYASVMAEEELIAQSRKRMIEDDVYDDYTRASNALDIAERAGGFLTNLFNKKKKKK